MNIRRLLSVGALGAALLLCSLGATAGAGVGVWTCNQAHWCTITASGDVTPTASQLAIGNVSAGTALAVTQNDTKHQQVGGEILGGNLRGTCAWSQYVRDWTTRALNTEAGCPNPVFDTASFVADGGQAVWSGCYPRCFGGVPLRFDRRCGTPGHNWCYSTNCEEYANFYPWTQAAHPADPIRTTHRDKIDIRYLARYGDVWTNSPFYLVRDVSAPHGAGNWVFVSGAACGISAGHPGVYRWLPHALPGRHRKPVRHLASAARGASA